MSVFMYVCVCVFVCVCVCLCLFVCMLVSVCVSPNKNVYKKSLKTSVFSFEIYVATSQFGIAIWVVS